MACLTKTMTFYLNQVEVPALVSQQHRRPCLQRASGPGLLYSKPLKKAKPAIIALCHLSKAQPSKPTAL